MRTRAYILVLLTLGLFGAAFVPQAWADPAPSQEYRIKAAFLYNFIKFVDWPKQKMGEANEPITIGIIGKDPFGKAFEPIKDKPVKGKKVVVKQFKGFKELKQLGEKDKGELDRRIEALRKCHMLFICSSEKDAYRDVVKLVREHPVLTVGEMKDFVEAGGVINFVMENKKVRFEINAAGAKRAKLQIRSQLLRLAKKVVQEKDAPKNDD
ncbi:MAG: YfiR family protein [Planctomycetes bacterium]|nr:YfiR family protein [Planctomycetota bacterium]